MLAADFSTLVIVLVIAAIANWLKKKGDDDQTSLEDDEETYERPPPRRAQSPPPPVPQRTHLPPPPQRTAPPAPTSDWEEELRRMLEGEKPAPPPIVRPSAPKPIPTVVHEEPPVYAPPPVYRQPAPAPVSLPPVPTRKKKEFGALQESSAAHSRVERMDSLVTQRLNQVSATHHHFYKTVCKSCSGKIEFPASSAGTRVDCPHCGEQVLLVIQETAAHLATSVVHRQVASDAAIAAVRLIRNPHTAGQAIIASIILGPPKALASENGTWA